MGKMVECTKLARPDGWDFYTGRTINYRGEGNYPHIVKAPNPDAKLGVCSSGVIHASVNPNDCFVGARIPCSAFRVRGKPVCGEEAKYGFLELEVLGEISDLNNLFGWNYTEAVNPLNPFKLRKRKPTRQDIELLKVWASVRDSVRASVGDSVWDSVWDSLGASLGASVGAYVGSLFPNIKRWKYFNSQEGEYPFQPSVDLWKRGLVPSFDGKVWRLHSGKHADIVWEGDLR